MPCFAGVAGGAESRLAADDDPDSDADLPGNEQQIGHPGLDTAAMFAQRPEIGLVGHGDVRVEPSQTLGEHVAERDIPPAEVGSKVDVTVGAPRDPDDRHAHPGEVVTLGQRTEKWLGEFHRVIDRLIRREAVPRSVDSHSVENVAPEADGRHGDRVDRQVDGEDDRTLWCGGHDR